MSDAVRPYVTVVSGVPRSGTSMMMRMLHRSGMDVLVDEHRAADDDNPRGYYEYQPAKGLRSDASWVPLAEGRAVKLVYLLLAHLPADRDYRVVLMRRNLDEVVASQRVMLERKGADAGPLDDGEVIRLFERGLAEARAWAGRSPRVRMHEVHYNDLMERTRPVVEGVAAFLDEGCEARLDVDAMESVVDPSLYRQRGA